MCDKTRMCDKNQYLFSVQVRIHKELQSWGSHSPANVCLKQLVWQLWQDSFFNLLDLSFPCKPIVSCLSNSGLADNPTFTWRRTLDSGVLWHAHTPTQSCYHSLPLGEDFLSIYFNIQLQMQTRHCGVNGDQILVFCSFCSEKNFLGVVLGGVLSLFAHVVAV